MKYLACNGSRMYIYCMFKNPWHFWQEIYELFMRKIRQLYFTVKYIHSNLNRRTEHIIQPTLYRLNRSMNFAM